MIFKILLFIKRSFIGRRFFNNRISRLYYGVARGMKRRGGIGVLALFLKKDTQEQKFILSLSFANKTVFDIGANFGEFTMFFAKATRSNGRVIAFDPIRQNCEAIAENISLNNLNNVQIIQIGVGSHKELKKFTVDPDATQLASSNEDIKKTTMHRGHSREMIFEIHSLDAIISEHKLPQPDFVKIDVEGMEKEVLQGMRHCLKDRKPELFIEVHGLNIEAGDINNQNASAENIKKLYDILKKFDYSITHVESSAQIHSDNFEIAKSGHLYCV